MSNVAISVEGLGKRYRIGTAAERHDSIREALTHAVKAPVRNLGRLGRLKTIAEDETDVVWALRDVSFEVQHGEVLGIIGRNGAGKSTLLKILSRITKPTTGQARVNGRVGSLLEVGTGFHPELTGRENVFLNGSILGMDRAHIERKFDDIVEFSGVERYIDTPVKRYSSGMYLRLAFSVAAHLDPDVLVVDEVLAVGDAEFQKKCLGKMEQVAHTGRTVLFVSHNMGAIRQLCTRGLYLIDGAVHHVGEIGEIVDRYVRNYSDEQKREVTFEPKLHNHGSIVKAAVRCPPKPPACTFDINDQLEIEIEYILHEKMTGVNVGFSIFREGVQVFTSFDIDVEAHLFASRESGLYRARIGIPTHLLKAGLYTVLIGMGRSGIGILDQHLEALVFEIGDESEDTTHKGYAASRGGVLALELPWNTQRI